MTTKEKAAAVKTYCEKNPIPDSKFCPVVKQRFNLSSGTVIWNNVTGERKATEKTERQLWAEGAVPVRPYYIGLFVRYISGLDALEIAQLYMDGRRGKDGEKKSWSYSSPCDTSQTRTRVFIFHEDTTAYWSNGETISTKKKYANETVQNLIKWLPANSTVFDAVKAEGELKKFDPNYKREYDYASYFLDNLKEWYRLAFYPRGKKKAASKAVDFSAYEINDIPEYVPPFERDSSGWWYSYNKHFDWFQILDDNYAVIRSFDCRFSREGELISKNENQRVFISAKGKPAVFQKSWDKWERRARTMHHWGRDENISLANIDDITQWKPLSYIKDILSIDKDSAKIITTILRHPVIETLCKSGYTNIADKLLDNDNVAANLRDLFGVKKEIKKGSLYKMFGVNRYLLEKLDKRIGEGGYSYYLHNVVPDIKTLYGKADITDLSKEQIDLVFPVFGTGSYILNSVFDGGSWFRRDFKTEPVSDSERSFFLRLCKMNQRTNVVNVFRLYTDTKRLARSINANHGIDTTNFHNVEELQRIHDALTNIFNREQAEREAYYNAKKEEKLKLQKEKFEKLQPKRVKKYEYSDGEFCTKMPEQPTDLISEGAALHHCVGGYVDSHALGETDIIFLRRKAEEDKPFYTIEIKGNRVVQIHGLHNRWLGNNPEAIPFVYEWLEKLGVNYEKKLLLNLGTGYGSSSNNLPESYLLRKGAA